MRGEQVPVAPEVSIVIPCRGHVTELADCLAGLERQHQDRTTEIVVVTGPEDPEVEEAVGAFPTVRLVRSDRPLFAGEARNLGVRESSGNVVAFIDADSVPDPDWLCSGVEAIEGGALLAGGPVLNALPWHPVAPIDNLLQFADQGPRRPSGDAAYLPGCNIAVQRELFLRLGGFPEGMAIAEDIALSREATKFCKHALRYVSKMIVRHRGRTSLRELWRHQMTFGYERGNGGYFLSNQQQRFGARLIFFPLVVLRRLAYIAGRTAQWNPLGLLRILLLSPVLLYGLVAWAKGFRRGCREAMGD